ncbi:MAG: nitronate monooxygenase [candidate division KSB1 bacterium]|nr:nitronate monooxygenase [candidate division KSB1 bacterium]
MAKKLPKFKTRVTELFGIEYPIIQGGMSWVADHHLVVPVCEAGGLGVLGAGSMSPSQLHGEIAAVRAGTSKPFAVNVPLTRSDAPKLIRVCLDLEVKIIFTSAGNPAVFTPQLKEKGVTVVHVVSNVRQAVRAERAGVDAVVAEGFEAGGHVGREEIGTITLVPQVVDAVSVPVIAAGGIADARGFVAALALGAEGVQVGTRFAATVEANCSIYYKNAIVRAEDAATVVVTRSLIPTRVIRNALAEQLLRAEQRGAQEPQLREILQEGRARMAIVDGELAEGLIEAGQSAGLVKSLRTVELVFEDFLEGYVKVLRRLQGLVEVKGTR